MSQFWNMYLQASGALFWIDLILALFVIFAERKKPTSTLLWVMVILAFPLFGFLFYLLLGVDLSKSKMFEDKDQDSALVKAQSIERISLINKGQYKYHDIKAYDYESLIKILSNNSFSKYVEHNKVDIFYDGPSLKDDIIEELKKAKNSIYIQFYIVKSGRFFNEIKEVLIEKAREGVEVRLLIDGMGGRQLKKNDLKDLKEAGVEYGVFFPTKLGIFNIRINFRNHRKIIVIDSKVGYLGGFNIGDEYINKSTRFGFWRDTHIKISGEAVNDLTDRFYLDYKFASGNGMGRYQTFCGDLGKDHVVAMNIVTSGPDHELEQIRDGYSRMISMAKNRIYIQTPYFIPDDGLFKDLRMAAYSGVDVRIMVPKKPDHPFVKSASRSYLGELLKFGAKVYYYEEHGFLHSKVLLVDNFISTVGTANFDIRSFSLNFEINAFIYDYGVNHNLAQQFEKDIEECEDYTIEMYFKRSIGEKGMESISRLLSPVL
ncbi:MAG: cardiolipin synthase [Tissierellia bacterium]|nr:cardiolipin synthase [Tissierellia bacterium]